MSYVLVFIGGGLGSITRFAVSNHFGALPNGFPLATFLSNTISCVILGISVSILFSKTHSAQSAMYLVLFTAVGFCGGFSTFSTFSLDTFQLFNKGEYSIALLNVLANVVVCYIAIAAGFFLGKLL